MPRFPDQLLYIGGRYVPARGGHTFEVINPATGEVLANVHNAGADDLTRRWIAPRPANSSGPR